MSAKFVLSLSVYAAILGVIGDAVNRNVPEPYMDEIFHIPQAQSYCAGNFSHWDSKITTLPGLYLFSVGILDPAYKLSSALGLADIEPCSVSLLRSVNLLMSCVNLVLLHSLTTHLHGEKEGYSEVLGVWSSLNMSLMPVLYFYSFLYYTDQVSTALTLLTFCLHLSGRDWVASLSAVLAVLARQTNIVWTFLCGALAAANILISEVRLHQARTKHPPTISLTLSGQVRELAIGVRDLAVSPTRVLRIIGLVLVRCGGYLITGLGFLLFVHVNKGVVVGDRTAHTVTLHLLQLGYFAAFYLGLSLPFAVRSLPDLARLLRQQWRRLAVVAGLVMAVVHYNTQAHPYLLADNRHFTFYIWRRLVTRHWTLKYLLTPVYMAGGYHISQSLLKSDLVLKLLLPLCVVINILPQLLLEFRYFIVPYLLIRAQIKPACWRSLALETVMSAAVNAITIYIFLYKPFRWESEPNNLQRFMW